ncbi:MAG: hypothetical protein ACOC0J_01390 [Myxococcota bacterium]
MADAAFIWETNIAQVAQEISAGLSRIRGDMTRTIQGGAPGGVDADRFGFLPRGIENRVQRLANELDANLKRVAANYAAGMEAAAKKGAEPFKGVSIGGGEYTTDFRRAAAVEVQKAQRGLAAIARDVSKSFTGPLAGMRGEILQQVEGLARGVTRGADQMVRTLAVGGEYRGQQYTGLTALRDQLRPRAEGRMVIAGGLPASVETSLVRTVTEAFASVDVANFAAIDREGAFARLRRAAGEGGGSFQDIQTDTARHQKKVSDGFATMDRVITDVRANLQRTLGPRGELQWGRAGQLPFMGGPRYAGRLAGFAQVEFPQGPSRARREGDTYFDRRGVAYREAFDEDTGESLGFEEVQQQRKTAAQLRREAQELIEQTGVAGPKLREAFDAEIDERVQALAAQRTLSARLEGVGKDRVDLERRAAQREAYRLQGELMEGVATRQVEVGRGFARRGDEFFRFTSEGAVPVQPGTPEALRAEQAIAKTRLDAEREAYSLRDRMIKEQRAADLQRARDLEKRLVAQAREGRAVIAGSYIGELGDTGAPSNYYRVAPTTGARQLEEGTRDYLKAQTAVHREMVRNEKLTAENNDRQERINRAQRARESRPESQSRFGTFLRTAAGEGAASRCCATPSLLRPSVVVSGR